MVESTRSAEAFPTMYEERQPVAAWVYGLMGVLWLIVLATSLAILRSWSAADPAERSWSDFAGPVIGVVVMGGITFLIGGIRVSVGQEELTVRFGAWPKPVRIALSDIASCRAVTYRPLAQFGGWGVRRAGRTRAYTARGNRGVLLMLRDGRRALIGSDTPEQLAGALGQLGARVLDPVDELPALEER